MSIDLGGTDVCVPQQFLNGAQVIAIFQQTSGKAVAKGMAARVLANCSLSDGFLYGLLRGAQVQMMTPQYTTARVSGDSGGRKQKLPGGFALCIGVLARKSKWQIHSAIAIHQILLMQRHYFLNLGFKGIDQTHRQ